MYRGTTPSITFRINNSFELTHIKQVWVTFKSKFAEITYDIDHVELDLENNMIRVQMSQEDTLAFTMKGKYIEKVEAQMRFLDDEDKAFASNIVTVDMLRILKEGVIE